MAVWYREMETNKDDIIKIFCVAVITVAAFIYFQRHFGEHKKCIGIDFIYKRKKVPFFQHTYNCGFLPYRLTERGLEIAITQIWLRNTDGKVVEIGAVTPYYWKGAVDDVCDPADQHEAVNLKTSMFNLDLTGKNVLSVSTIEHIGLGEYGVPIQTRETAVLALDKILKESKTCLVTFPVGYNLELDNYVIRKEFYDLYKNITLTFYVRNTVDNNFVEEKDFEVVRKTPYGPRTANAVVIIEKTKD